MALPPTLALTRTQQNLRAAKNPATEGLLTKLQALLFSDTEDDADARAAGKSVLICSGEGAPAQSVGANVRAIYLREDAPDVNSLIYAAVNGTWSPVPITAIAASLLTLARGRMIRGSATGVGEALDLSALGRIPRGDGTDIQAFDLSGTGGAGVVGALDTAAPADYWTTDTLQAIVDAVKAIIGGTNETTRTYHATPMVLANNDALVTSLGKLETWLQALRLTLPVPADVTVTDPAGDLAFNAGCIVIRGFGAAPDAVITCSGLRDGETAMAVCGAEAITLTDGATLALGRDQNLVLATGDIVAITRHGAVYYVTPVFVQAGVTTSASGTGATSSTAVRGQTHLGALAAAGVAYHAAYAGGAGAIDDAAGPWVQLLPTRTVQITGDAATVAADWTIDLQFADGGAGTDIIAHPGGAVTATGTKAGRITRVRSSVDPGAGASVLVETGPGFGVGSKDIQDIVVGVDGVVEAPASTDSPSGTVTPTTAPNAAHVYDVRYRVDHTHTGPSHTHQE